ncbi:hypothetical protein Droror1_Dr00018992 [Drosera rotundifolia]
MQFLLRDLNLETSQTVFAGPYLSQQEREMFSADYALLNTRVMKLPIDLPGFAFKNTKLAISRMLDTLTVCAARSKERMDKGENPESFIDFWMQDTVREEKKAGQREGIPRRLTLLAARSPVTCSISYSLHKTHPLPCSFGQ